MLGVLFLGPRSWALVFEGFLAGRFVPGYSFLEFSFLEHIDGNDTAPKQKLKLGIYPAPQYSTRFPQYQYREPQTPKYDPARVVLLPHIL
jgi:hypothetical protein